MCIIIAKKAGVKRLDPEYFNRAWDRNPDGGGLVWKKPGEEVYIQKGFMNKQEFLNKIDELNQDDTAFIAHFRIKSVGAVCADNTHPFNMGKVTFAHNGTLSIQAFEGKTDSETFGLCFLKDKSMGWIKRYQTLLEMALHTSKFAIMDNINGEILILNQDLGKERDGAWFSNESAFPPVVSAYTPPTKCSGYDSRYGYWSNGQGYCKGFDNIKPTKNFGTKKYTKEYAKLNNKKVWIYTSTGTPLELYGYKKTRINTRGFAIIDPNIEVPVEAKNHKYSCRSPEVLLMNRDIKTLYAGVAEYHKFTFKDRDEREELECDLSAQFTVLDAMRRFIRAGKAIDSEEFLSFCCDNTESEPWMTKYYSSATYGEYVQHYAADVLSRLEAA